MKRYEVIVTRDATESVVIEVNADSEDEACFKALDDAKNAQQWEINDDHAPDPYLAAGRDDVTEIGS